MIYMDANLKLRNNFLILRNNFLKQRIRKIILRLFLANQSDLIICHKNLTFYQVNLDDLSKKLDKLSSET